jgi:hypothetical protein
VKAWDVVWSGNDTIVTHLDAETRGKARAIVFDRVRDAGYKPKFTEFSATVCRFAGTDFCGARK